MILASVLSGVLTFFFVLLCVVMILSILIQRPKGGGLSGAFGGGGGGGGAVFGAKSGDVLTWFTVALFIGFLVLGVSLVFVVRNDVLATDQPDSAVTQPENANQGQQGQDQQGQGGQGQGGGMQGAPGDQGTTAPGSGQQQTPPAGTSSESGPSSGSGSGDGSADGTGGDGASGGTDEAGGTEQPAEPNP